MNKAILFILTILSLPTWAANYQTVPAETADSLITAHFADASFYIIDVRTPSEYEGGHLRNSLNIDFRSDKFSNLLDTLDLSATYLIYCHSGSRSAGAFEIFKEKQFETVFELQNGYRNWPYETTTDTIRQQFSFADAELAYAQATSGNYQIFNISDSESAQIFSIDGSVLIDAEADALLDSVAQLDKTTPILLYSSNGTDLSESFQHLFTDGFLHVSYFNQPITSWIDAGYAYDSEDKSNRDTITQEPETKPEFNRQTSTPIETSVRQIGSNIDVSTHKPIALFTMAGNLIATLFPENGSITFDKSNYQGLFIMVSEYGVAKIQGM